MQSYLSTIWPRSPRWPAPASTVPTPQPEPYIYVRVSTYLQKQKGFSLPHQVDLCREAARQAGIADVPETNWLHGADSGKNVQRTALQTLLDAVKAGRVSIVYCPKVDRLGRNARDCLEILDMLHDHSVELVLVENHIDTRTPMGRLFFTLLAGFAEWESESIKERTWNGKYEKLRQLEDAQRAPSAGRRNTLCGYRCLPPEQKGRDGTWERHPDQWRWVLWIFRAGGAGQGRRQRRQDAQ